MPREKYSTDKPITFKVPEELYTEAQECAEALRMYYADFYRMIFAQGVRQVARQLFPERYISEEQWGMIIRAAGVGDQYRWVLQRLVDMAKESPPPDLTGLVEEENTAENDTTSQ